MISKSRSFWPALLAVLCLVVVVGCGDTFRQFITAVPGPTGDPGNLSHAVVLSTNPASGAAGSDLHINVSGDTIAGIVPVGPNPLFFGDSQGRAAILNGDNTVSLYTGLLPLTATVTTAVQLGSVSGQVAAGFSANGSMYIANSISNDVSFISSSANTVTQAIPVGSHPVMVAGGPASSKVYVVNQGDNTVTVISTLDNAVLKTITVGAQPIWAVMSTDGEAVFVVNQGENTLSFIDTNLDAEFCSTPPPQSFVPCAPATRIQVGSSPNFAFYDSPRKRVYVTNTGSKNVSVIKADGINFGTSPPVLPALIKNVPVSGFPLSVTALQDGTRAYVALANCTDPATNHTNLAGSYLPSGLLGGPTHLSNCNGNLVSVIDAVGLLESKTITVGPGAVSVDASADSSRVYVVSAHDATTIKDNMHNPSCPIGSPCTTTGAPCLVLPCLAGPPLPDRLFPNTPSVSIIKTSSDTVLRYTTDPSVPGLVPSFLTPPQGACSTALDLTFNKTFSMPCPGQTPFIVKVIP
ncbi:MAG TPA: YncE family protein [Verrucomicrobiae bacterium]|jgi:YVTN family beta-propeller protein|nr:YncE family protein [Verrucomicrobiae bacterium]